MCLRMKMKMESQVRNEPLDVGSRIGSPQRLKVSSTHHEHPRGVKTPDLVFICTSSCPSALGATIHVLFLMMNQ